LNRDQNGKEKNINRSVYLPRRTNAFLTALATTNDMTHLRRTGTTVGAKVLFTEYTPFK
jgi:hypothetical protein